MRVAADTLKKITLELGGKSPNIVLADADLDAALRGATTGIFYGKGEVCAAGSRLLVDRSIKSEFMDKLAARARRWSPAIRWIPRRAMARWPRRSRSRPCSATSIPRRRRGPGSSPAAQRADIGTGKGYFFQPTVFDDVTPEMTIAREEIFGPVLAAIEFADVDEAIARANDTPVRARRGGLDARHQEGALRRAASCRRGPSGSTPTTSTTPPRRSVATRPSGFGREMSAHALEHYTQVKSVWVDLNL